jgi:RNA-splicing ligase RtcB
MNDVDFQHLDTFIRCHIPHGFKNNTKVVAEFEGPYKSLKEDIVKVCNRVTNKKGVNLDAAKVLQSIGSLGGGNHFIELNIDEDDQIWLTIHSGSRNFGLQVANYHQRIARELLREDFDSATAYKGLEFLVDSSQHATSYIYCMEIAQKMAELNRFTMAKTIINRFFKMAIKELETIKSIHNYIDFNDGIIRKGAIAAHKDQELIIPINMKNGSIIGVGKGNADWNYSAPHGAGRVLGRKQAKAQLSLAEFKEQMSGVWTSSVSDKTIDESPGAYKDIQLILDNVGDTIDILSIMLPIYNFKAGD